MKVLYGLIGGFIYFLYKLEAPGMGNVLFRVNSIGCKVFSLESLFNMMLAPFMYIAFWTRIELYPINWIITTILGGLCIYIINIFEKLYYVNNYI